MIAHYLLSVLLYFTALAGVNERHHEQQMKHIVFLISEDPDNYEAPRTIPVFAEELEKDHPFRVTVLLGEGERSAFHFPALEVISGADLVVVFCRRVALPGRQLKLVKDYLASGKPLVGIRTAHHAFSATGEISAGHEAWPEFPAVILGCENRGYGKQEIGVDVTVAPAAQRHPILKDVKPSRWHSEGSIYYVAPLLDNSATVLLTGTFQDKEEPVAWTRYTDDNSRIFYTSLGYPSDFEKSQYNQLLTNGIYWALGLVTR